MYLLAFSKKVFKLKLLAFQLRSEIFSGGKVGKWQLER